MNHFVFSPLSLTRGFAGSGMKEVCVPLGAQPLPIKQAVLENPQLVEWATVRDEHENSD